MKIATIALTVSLAMGAGAAMAPSAQAVGCLSGAAVGGVAGHMAGHHAVLGAIGGCAVGHHMKNKQKRAAAAQAQQGGYQGQNGQRPNQ
jgi:hypothetical protein